MSENIPFEIQMEVIKRVPDIKSLLRFRSVSKPWKCFIDSSEFIAGYGARDTQPHSLFLRYKDSREDKYVCFVDDDENDTLTQQQDFSPNVPDIMKQFKDLKVIGSSHGLLCLYSDDNNMLVLCNPSLKKCVGVALPDTPLQGILSPRDIFGFAVLPATNDPTIVMISYPNQVSVFTLSSKSWTVIPCTTLPSELLKLISSQVVIDSCIYWVVLDMLSHLGGDHRDDYMIMSFDLVAKEFRVIDIPNSLINAVSVRFFITNPGYVPFFISKLRESLVLFASNEDFEMPVCGVWKMEHDESFTKLFSISTPDCIINNVLGFRKNGELVMLTEKEDERFDKLEAYEPCSEHIINNLWISGVKGSFFMDSYKKTLLLLNHSNGFVYPDLN